VDNKELIKKVVEEEVEMCKAIRDMIRDSKEEGIAEGREEGRETEIYLSVQEGDYGIVRGAEKLKISIQDFISKMTAAGYIVPSK